MERQLFRKVRDRPVLQLLALADRELAMLAPNGATVHKRDSLRQHFVTLAGVYRSMWRPYRNETMASFMKRSRRLCTMTLERLQQAMRIFNIPLE